MQLKEAAQTALGGPTHDAATGICPQNAFYALAAIMIAACNVGLTALPCGTAKGANLTQ